MSSVQEYVDTVNEMMAAWREEKGQITEKMERLESQIEDLKAQILIPEQNLQAVRATIEDIRGTVEAEVPETPEPPTTETPVTPEVPPTGEVIPPVEDTLPGAGVDTLPAVPSGDPEVSTGPDTVTGGTVI